MIEKRDFYIDGAWVAPLAPRDCPVIDPSTEEVCAVISLGSAADCDRAVAAAKAAFPTWAATPPARRAAPWISAAPASVLSQRCAPPQSIRVSTPGGGATFVVRLPASR